jgi:uncharacterized cupredoxin-like copper-binding protein
MHPDSNNERPDRFHRADHFTDRPDRRGVSSLLKHAAVALALVVLAAAGLVAGVATTNAADNQPHASKATSRVTVVAKEFSFTLSKRSVPVGTVIFTVVNRGKITHNFKIAGKTTKKLKPGQRTTLTVKFTKKGRYAYLCTLPGHAKLGMRGVLTVGKQAVRPTSGVTVVAKEFSFKLSKRTVPVGTVIFTVVNRGKITHNFKIAGKTTKNLNPGQKATLKVKFTKKGRYAYLCTLPGHAKLGMKGVLSIGVKAVTPPPTRTTTPTTTPPPTTTTGPVGSANTTVQVGMFEYRFDLSQSTMPSGQVTFVITNKGQQVHNFDILGVKVGKLLSPGQSETWTVALPAGDYSDQCDVPFHAGYGMVGSFTVTP